MLNPFLAAQVKFVVETLRKASTNDRAAMFAEVAKVYCLKCGFTKDKGQPICPNCRG